MTPETLARLEKMYTEVWPSAPAEIYQSFKDLAEALKQARDAVKEWQNHAKEQQEAFAFWFRAANDMAKERDELRDEVGRLKALLGNKP